MPLIEIAADKLPSSIHALRARYPDEIVDILFLVITAYEYKTNPPVINERKINALVAQDLPFIKFSYGLPWGGQREELLQLSVYRPKDKDKHHMLLFLTKCYPHGETLPLHEDWKQNIGQVRGM